RRGAAERHLHGERLGAVALAVALRAAQVHVAQELHLDVVEAVARACGAAPVAGVEAERAGRVLALARERVGCEQLAYSIEHADEARGIAARRAADRRLIDEHDVAELLRALERRVRAGRVL